jgi:opacity protein-like surface antigen
MKRILIGAVASIAVAGSALAADVPAPAYKAPVAPVVAFSWTGL